MSGPAIQGLSEVPTMRLVTVSSRVDSTSCSLASVCGGQGLRRVGLRFEQLRFFGCSMRLDEHRI